LWSGVWSSFGLVFLLPEMIVDEDCCGIWTPEGGRFTSFMSSNNILNAIRESKVVPMAESILCPL